MKNVVGLSLVLALGISCAKRERGSEFSDNDKQSSEDVNELGAETVTASIGGFLDDLSQDSYSRNSTPTVYTNILEEVILSKAYADDICVRPYNQACENGLKIGEYNGCTLPDREVQVYGQVQLAFSDSVCELANENDSVTRTFEYDLKKDEFTLSVTSADQADYRGESFGGGSHLVRTSNGWNLEIRGQHRNLKKESTSVRQASLRSLENIVIEGTLQRVSRKVVSGLVEVSNNTKEFYAHFRPENLTWNSTCCHPISGSLHVELFGSKEGEAQIQFTECGKAKVERDGKTKEITLRSCQ